MADVSHIITLGIGTPASIEHFVLVGLSPTGVVETTLHTITVDGHYALARTLDGHYTVTRTLDGHFTVTRTLDGHAEE